MATGYEAAKLDDIAHQKRPPWAPIRHHFDLRSLGAKAWRAAERDDVIEDSD